MWQKPWCRGAADVIACAAGRRSRPCCAPPGGGAARPGRCSGDAGSSPLARRGGRVPAGPAPF
jgi:hypothetical protein